MDLDQVCLKYMNKTNGDSIYNLPKHPWVFPLPVFYLYLLLTCLPLRLLTTSMELAAWRCYTDHTGTITAPAPAWFVNPHES